MSQIIRKNAVWGKLTLLVAMLALTVWLGAAPNASAQTCAEDCFDEYFACRAVCAANYPIRTDFYACVDGCIDQQSACIDACP